MLKLFAAFTIAALALMSGLSSPSQAVPGQHGDYPGQEAHEWCQAHGGQDVPQPPGSSITACCTSDACVICDANWENCAIDPAYSQRPRGGRPVLESPDIMAPPNGSSLGAPPASTIQVVPLIPNLLFR